MSSTLTCRLSMTSLCGNLIFSKVMIFVFAIWICLVADAWHRFGSVNGIKHFIYCIFLILVIIELYAVGTSCVRSTSWSWSGASAFRSVTSLCAPSLWWSFIVAISLALLFWPTASTKMIFMSTFMTFLTKCWTFLGGCECCIYCILYLSCFLLCIITCVAFLYLKVLISSTVVAITVPPLDLCLLKSFTLICVLWHVGRVLHMWHPLSSFLT